MKLDIKSVMVVDDKPGTGTATRKILQQLGVERVDYVTSAPEALRRLESRSPEIVICERYLQPINVLDLRRFMNLRDACRSIPILVVTHRRDPADEMRLDAADLPYRIARPFSAEELVEAVQRATAAAAQVVAPRRAAG